MTDSDKIDAIAEECLRLNENIQEYGTDMMKKIMHSLLFEVGLEVARQHVKPQASPPRRVM